MKIQMKVAKLAAIAVLKTVFLSTASLAGQTGQTRTVALPQPDVKAMVEAPHTRLIVVSLADHRLALVEDGVVKKIYAVAVGKESTPSPTGTFTIRDRVTDPTYYHAGEVIPPGPGNPVGTRWIGLNKAGYGIHGTNEPRSVGKAASHGCIRMRRRDLEQLFAQVRAGDVVEIIGQRDEETAAIFGEPGGPAGNAAPALTLAETQERAPAAAGAETATVAAAAPAER